MGVDVVDVLGLQTRLRERAPHGCQCAQALGVRMAHVVGVSAFTHTVEARLTLALAFQKEQRRAFADVEPVAIGTEGAAALRGDDLQAAKTAQSGLAERVGPTHEDSVAQAAFDESSRAAKDLAAR